VSDVEQDIPFLRHYDASHSKRQGLSSDEKGIALGKTRGIAGGIGIELARFLPFSQSCALSGLPKSYSAAATMPTTRSRRSDSPCSSGKPLNAAFYPQGETRGWEREDIFDLGRRQSEGAIGTSETPAIQYDRPRFMDPMPTLLPLVRPDCPAMMERDARARNIGRVHPLPRFFWPRSFR